MTSAVLTTSWDDGHVLDCRIADLLTKHGLSGTFYIPRTGVRDRLREEDIRQLASSFEIGAHTLNHSDLRRLSQAQARAEIVESKDWIEQVTGKPCRMFCFPMGRFRPDQLRFIQEAGYSGARTVELMSLEFPRFQNGALLMPTTLQVFSHSPSSYVKNAAKRLAGRNLLNLARSRFAAEWSAAASPLMSRAVREGGVFHLWGHSWEIEEHGQWQALDRVLQAMSKQLGSAQALTNGELCNIASARPSQQVGRA